MWDTWALDLAQQFSLSFPQVGVEMFGNRPGEFGFTVVDHDGLTGGPEFDDEDVPRRLGIGDFETEPRVRAREIDLEGYVRARSPIEMRDLHNRFNRLLNRGYLWMNVEQFGEKWKLHVKRIGRWRFDVQGTTGYARWSITLKASDPRYYRVGPERIFGPAQQIEVFHRGNYWARPTYTVRAITGMTSGYRVRWFNTAGETLGLIQLAPLPTGQTHTVDTVTGTVTRPGFATGQNRGGQLFHIPPDGVYTVRVGAIDEVGTGEIRLAVTDTSL